MKNKKKIYLILFITLFLGLFYYLSIQVIANNSFKNLRSSLSASQKIFIKKYVFPYQYISQLDNTINEMERAQDAYREELKYLIDIEVNFINSKNKIRTEKIEDLTLSNGMKMERYKILDGFYSGINKFKPGSGFIDFYKEKLFVLSSRGVFGFTEDLDSDFELIKNNIGKFIGLEQFKKHRGFSIKDLLVYNDKIFISYTDELKTDCWNTSIIYSEINYLYLEFKKLFSSDQCVHSINNVDNEFNPWQSGGRIIGLDNKHILFSVGEYRSRYLAQEKESINGKLVSLNLEDLSYKIISMGHRNPQGLYLDNDKNFILETEHGPKGGDEINYLKLENDNNKNIPNFGWPISSGGEHYDGAESKYKKYPLHKSHKKFGFVEPLITFVPSIAISEISKISDNRFVFGSMKDKSLYFFKLNKKFKIFDIERVEVNERIRDLKFKDGILYLFLEDTPIIAVINLF